jgi:hypothetical protein
VVSTIVGAYPFLLPVGRPDALTWCMCGLFWVGLLACVLLSPRSTCACVPSVPFPIYSTERGEQFGDFDSAGELLSPSPRDGLVAAGVEGGSARRSDLCTGSFS